MDIMQIQYVAECFFKMCREHPEICPHDWEWNWTTALDENGKRVEHYTCRLCGSEHEQIKD